MAMATLNPSRWHFPRALLRVAGAAPSPTTPLTADCAGSVAARVRVHIRGQRWLRSEDLGHRLIRALLVVDSASTANANDPNHHVVHDNRHPTRHQEETLRQSNQFLVDRVE